jgi:hypothetical protein
VTLQRGRPPDFRQASTPKSSGWSTTVFEFVTVDVAGMFRAEISADPHADELVSTGKAGRLQTGEGLERAR